MKSLKGNECPNLTYETLLKHECRYIQQTVC